LNYTLGINKLTSIYDYDEFLQLSEKTIKELETVELEETEKNLLEYRKINLVRSLRIAKTYKPEKNLLLLFQKIKRKQIWLIFTEDWCGDSAQNLPYLMKYIEQIPQIDAKIILREDNVAALKNYFGADAPLSIPKIVAFTPDGKELFRWGPRPQKANELVKKLKSESLEREELNKKLHLWYSRNKGKELEKEFTEILSKITS